MYDVKKPVRLVDVGGLEIELDNLLNLMLRDWADKSDETKCFCQSVAMESEDLKKLPTIDPKTLRPVAHWEEIPGSYELCAGENGSWCVPVTHCSNPECGEVTPCGFKTPFCPMCGFRMEDVPYDDD